MTPPTLAEWRRWAATATRNLTDNPVGSDPTRRHIDARASDAVTPAPTTADTWRQRKKEEAA